uniref:Uncharacterized protein n=1 Tax=Octopus bimaculoides TaxID=37653 RepID=A0A0L8IEV1_OCTBM
MMQTTKIAKYPRLNVRQSKTKMKYCFVFFLFESKFEVFGMTENPQSKRQLFTKLNPIIKLAVCTRESGGCGSLLRNKGSNLSRDTSRRFTLTAMMTIL